MGASCVGPREGPLELLTSLRKTRAGDCQPKPAGTCLARGGACNPDQIGRFGGVRQVTGAGLPKSQNPHASTAASSVQRTEKLHTPK